jgi:hypothetical protein
MNIDTVPGPRTDLKLWDGSVGAGTVLKIGCSKVRITLRVESLDWAHLTIMDSACIIRLTRLKMVAHIHCSHHNSSTTYWPHR